MNKKEREKRERAIESKTKIPANHAMAAYRMVRQCGSSRELAEKQIERGIGDVAMAAGTMQKHCGSSKKWAERLIKKYHLTKLL